MAAENENIAATVTDVSERVSALVRDEIELARVEITQKVKALTRGIIWFAIAGGLALFGVIFIPITIAWVLDAILVDGAGDIWVGFLIVAAAFLLLAGVFALLGLRKLKAGAPPVPAMAIDEAKKIRATVTAGPPA